MCFGVNARNRIRFSENLQSHMYDSPPKDLKTPLIKNELCLSLGWMQLVKLRVINFPRMAVLEETRKRFILITPQSKCNQSCDNEEMRPASRFLSLPGIVFSLRVVHFICPDT